MRRHHHLRDGLSGQRILSAVSIRGRDGRSLQDDWRDGAEAYLGVTVAGYPNLFLLYGPNTNGVNSIIFMHEAQAHYTHAALKLIGAARIPDARGPSPRLGALQPSHPTRDGRNGLDGRVRQLLPHGERQGGYPTPVRQWSLLGPHTALRPLEIPRLPPGAHVIVGSRRIIALLALFGIVAAACSSSASTPRASPAAAAPSSVASPVPSSGPSAGGAGTARSVCGNPGRPPRHYRAIVVFTFENRTWDDVGLGFGPGMPYLHGIGAQCGYFSDWTETDTRQNSLSQYVGQVTGAPQPGTKDDCSPSSSCSTNADNVFRQASRAGLTAVNYVEGASSPCSAGGNASKHIPALYLWSAADRARCDDQVRPLTDFHPSALPAFSFVTPTLCNDGHDCSNDVVDRWAGEHIQPVLASAAYRRGEVAVFVWYDEDHPVPNLWITPTAARGPIAIARPGYAATLKAWEDMLGLPCLANACTAPDMRARANS